MKIIDFGIAGLFNKCGHGEKNNCFTLSFAAPELITGRDIESKPSLDVWSLGVILYYLLSRIMPFGGKQTSEFSMFESI